MISARGGREATDWYFGATCVNCFPQGWRILRGEIFLFVITFCIYTILCQHYARFVWKTDNCNRQEPAARGFGSLTIVLHEDLASVSAFYSRLLMMNLNSVGLMISMLYWCAGYNLLDASPQAIVSAHGSRDPGKPAWAEHFSYGGGMTLSANHSSCMVFTNAFDRVFIFMRFGTAELHSWNPKRYWQAVSKSCCLLRAHWLGAKDLYSNVESSIVINDTSGKKMGGYSASGRKCSEGFGYQPQTVILMQLFSLEHYNESVKFGLQHRPN